MKVFVLQWNPEISSYRMEDFTADLANFEGEWFNWSIWDWKEAHEGDMFFLIKCGGEGPNGIVMQGHFTSEPYVDEDWSGKGRVVHYMDMEPEYMIHPERCDILTTEALEEAMPEFQWKGGHSGREVPFMYVLELEAMWTKYLEAHKDFFDGEKAVSLEDID